MIDPILTLFPPVPADDETERAARARALTELRDGGGRGGAERCGRPAARWGDAWRGRPAARC